MDDKPRYALTSVSIKIPSYPQRVHVACLCMYYPTVPEHKIRDLRCLDILSDQLQFLTGHYSRGISRFARPFGCIARKLANDQLLFCALLCCCGLSNRLASAPDPFPALQHFFPVFQHTCTRTYNIESLGMCVRVNVESSQLLL